MIKTSFWEDHFGKNTKRGLIREAENLVKRHGKNPEKKNDRGWI